MSDYKRLMAERALRGYTDAERARARTILGYLGDGSGNTGVVVPERSDWVYVRLYGSTDAVVQARNPGRRVLPYDNLRVRVRRVRRTGQSFYEVVGYDEGNTWSTGGGNASGIPGDLAGGDLAGTYPNPTVIGLYGNPMGTGIPNTGEFLKWNGSQWVGAAFIGLATGSAAGGDLTGTLPNPTVAKIQGRAVASTIPGLSSGLVWDGLQWLPRGVVTHDTIYYADISGNALNPTVAKLRGRNVADTAPGHGQFLGWNHGAQQWAPMTATGTTYGQTVDYPTAFSGDVINGSSATPFADVSAFDTKEVLNSRILHLVTKGASKDQRVRVTLGTTKANDFDVRVCLAVNAIPWAAATGDYYLEVRLATSGDSQIAIARITPVYNPGTSPYQHSQAIRVGGSSLTALDANIEPKARLMDVITLRFTRDGSDNLLFYYGYGTAPMALAAITDGGLVPYTVVVSGTLARVEIAMHSPSGPAAASQIEAFVDYVSST